MWIEFVIFSTFSELVFKIKKKRSRKKIISFNNKLSCFSRFLKKKIFMLKKRSKSTKNCDIIISEKLTKEMKRKKNLLALLTNEIYAAEGSDNWKLTVIGTYWNFSLCGPTCPPKIFSKKVFYFLSLYFKKHWDPLKHRQPA